MNPILVIGATGTVGRQVVSRLVDTGTQVRAMARNPGAARLPPQVEVVRGDLTLPETLDGCFDGIDTVFLVWTAPPAAVAPALEQIVPAIGRVIGRSLRIEEISPDEARGELLTIGPLVAVNMLLAAWAAAIGHPEHVTSTVEEITGASAKTFLDWATDNAAEFRA